jgi:hypothetical protein
VARDYASENIDLGFPTYIIVDLEGVQRVKIAAMNGITPEDVQEQYEVYLSEQ